MPVKIPALTALNLSLASACGADCIFCPTNRGERIRAKTMPLELAKHAIDQAAIVTDTVKIKEFSFGENGDAWINKQILDVFRYAKEKMPDAYRLCATNMQNLTPERIEEIIRDDLLHSIDFNIDGLNDVTFNAAKGLSIKYVNERFNKLLETRAKYNSNLRIVISILPARRYAEEVIRRLGKPPIKMKDPAILSMPDESAAIIEAIRPALRSTDQIYNASPFLWAEREQVDPSTLDYSQYRCPSMNWVMTKSYIAPNGDWYACCFDADNELTLGNITTQSLHDIATGETRRVFLERLMQQKFGEIGGPCATVNCCANH